MKIRNSESRSSESSNADQHSKRGFLRREKRPDNYSDADTNVTGGFCRQSWRAGLSRFAAGATDVVPDTTVASDVPATSSLAEPTREERRRSDFAASLAELRDRGVKIKFAPAAFVTTEGFESDDDVLVTRVLEDVILQTTKFRFVDAGGIRQDPFNIFAPQYEIFTPTDLNPQDFLEDGYGGILMADPDLVDSSQRANRQVLVAPYELHIAKSDGTFRLSATNWVTGETVASYEMREEELEPIFWQVLCLQMAAALKADYSRRSLEAAVAALPSAEGDFMPETGYLYDDEDASSWKDAEKSSAAKSWQSLRNSFDIEFTSQPEGTDVDTAIRHITYDVMHASGRAKALGPINVNGNVEQLTFAVKDKRLALELAKDERLTPFLTDESGKNAIGESVEPVQDKYGNLIMPVFGETQFELPLIGKIGKPRTIFAGFMVMPPQQFAHNDKDGFAPVGVDLSQFGFGDYPVLYKQKVEQPVATAEANGTPYDLYSTVTDKDEAQQQAIFERASAEITGVESFFGNNPGDVVKAVALIPSNMPNAHASPVNPDMISIWDELFPEVVAEDGQFAASHESFHVMDFKLGISKNEALKNLFEVMSQSYDKALFPLIDERNYLEFGGGHSQENVQEFVASLLNTVYTGKFRETYDAMEPRLRSLYELSIAALRDALIAGGSSESAPVIGAIDGILTWSARDTSLTAKDFVVPTMEDLLMPPEVIAQMIAELQAEDAGAAPPAPEAEPEDLEPIVFDDAPVSEEAIGEGVSESTDEVSADEVWGVVPGTESEPVTDDDSLDMLMDLPVFILPPDMFKKAILKSKTDELSMVYVYHANEQETVDLVKINALMGFMMGAQTYAMPYNMALLFGDKFDHNVQGATIYIFQRGKVVSTMPLSEMEGLRDVFSEDPAAEETVPSFGDVEALFGLPDAADDEPLPEIEEEPKGDIDDLLPPPLPSTPEAQPAL